MHISIIPTQKCPWEPGEGAGQGSAHAVGSPSQVKDRILHMKCINKKTEHEKMPKLKHQSD